MSDIIECRICGNKHDQKNCPAVKRKDEMSLIFCKLCGCHYTDGCSEHRNEPGSQVKKA